MRLFSWLREQSDRVINCEKNPNRARAIRSEKARKRRCATLCAANLEVLEARTLLATVPLTISFTHLFQVSNPDSDGTDGDYYARVTIGNNPEHVTARIEDDDFNPSAVDPSWTITDQVDPFGGPVPITIQLWDYDGFLNGSDDPLDIDPSPSAS